MDIHVPTELPELLHIPYSANNNLTCLNQALSIASIRQLYDWEFAVVIYNTQVCFIIQHECVCTYSFPWFAWYVMLLACPLAAWLEIQDIMNNF